VAQGQAWDLVPVSAPSRSLVYLFICEATK